MFVSEFLTWTEKKSPHINYNTIWQAMNSLAAINRLFYGKAADFPKVKLKLASFWFVFFTPVAKHMLTNIKRLKKALMLEAN